MGELNVWTWNKTVKPTSVEEADRLMQLRKQLIEEFKSVKRIKTAEYNKYKTQEQPVIDTIIHLWNLKILQ